MLHRISPIHLIWVLILAFSFVLVGCQKTLPQPEVTTAEKPAGEEAEVVAHKEATAILVTNEAPTSKPSPTETAVPTPTPIPLGDLSFAVQESNQIPTSDDLLEVGDGIEVQVAIDALDEETSGLEISRFEINPSWRLALEQSYTIDAPFIAVAADGQNDSQGRVLLRFPAPEPESRLVVIIDFTYMAVLDTPPQDGYLETAIRVGPGTAPAREQVGTLVLNGSLQYTVMTPKSSTADARYRMGKLAGKDPNSCGIEINQNIARSQIEICRQNSAKTVQVNYLSGLGLSTDEADQLAETIAAAMTRYKELGFVPAGLSSSSPMQIVVKTSQGDPSYSSMNGVIYLPVDAVRAAIGGESHDVLHELAHWIQDEEYIMTLAALSGGKTWWIETAAENMVMLHDPQYIPMNLTTYGNASTEDNRLVLQQSPYQWPGTPGNFYVHAQLVKVNMCDDTAVCPLSEKSFISAINQGSYPYADADAQSKLSANLDAYAKYLLGSAPDSANTTMPLGASVSSGDRYGEHIQVAQTTKTEYDIKFNGVAPQMKLVSDITGETVVVEATLQKDGVYPLVVSSGFNGRNPGLPVALTIQPGASLWYRLGDDAPQFHDGSEELVLSPIHLDMGLPDVRLVALGKEGREIFKATLSQIDLQGAWLFFPGAPISDDIVCVSDDVEAEADIDKNGLLMLPTFASILGDFKLDTVGNGLTWDWNNDRIPPELSSYTGSLLKFAAAAQPSPTDVKVQAEFEWVTEQSSQIPQESFWLPIILGVGAIIPGTWGLRLGRKKPYWGMFSLVIATFMLVGCFGFGLNIWGTVTADIQFTNLEYIGGDDIPVLQDDTIPDATPIWKMQGTAEYNMDFTVEVSAYTEEGTGTNTARCTGVGTFQVEGQIFKDAILSLE